MSDSANIFVKLISAFVGVKGALKFLAIALSVAFVPKNSWVMSISNGLTAIQAETVQLGIGFALGVLIIELVWALYEFIETKIKNNRKSHREALEQRKKDDLKQKQLIEKRDAIRKDAEYYLPTDSYVELKTLIQLKNSPTVTVNQSYCDKLRKYGVIDVVRVLQGNNTVDLEIKLHEGIRDVVVEVLDSYLASRVESFLLIGKYDIEKLKLLFSKETENAERKELFQEIKTWDFIEVVHVSSGDLERVIKKEVKLGQISLVINPIFKDATERFFGEPVYYKVSMSDDEIKTIA